MTENEQISNIVNGRLSFLQAVEQIALLLEREANSKALLIEGFGDAPDAAKLLDSFDQPYRSLYSIDLRDGAETLGKATLCFASDHPHGAQSYWVATQILAPSNENWPPTLTVRFD